MEGKTEAQQIEERRGKGQSKVRREENMVLTKGERIREDQNRREKIYRGDSEEEQNILNDIEKTLLKCHIILRRRNYF